MAAQRENSPSSPKYVPLSSKISAFGAKLSRTISGTYEHDEDGDSVANDLPVLKNKTPERSVSRGREAFQSSGRGGLGNIRQASVSRDARPDTGPDDFSSSRGREPAVNPDRAFSTGRGGAGNIRSPSRDVGSTHNPPPIDEAEQDVIKSYVAANQDVIHSTGRGGLGNITRSRSRGPPSATHSPSPARGGGGVHSPAHAAHLPVHSTGRGGAGNIVSGDGHDAELAEEEERKRHLAHEHQGIHSTGRGGAANLTVTPSPGVEHHAHPHGEFESTGRGGAGNIIRSRSGSRTRG